jgi:hypothetical protein
MRKFFLLLILFTLQSCSRRFGNFNRIHNHEYSKEVAWGLIIGIVVGILLFFFFWNRHINRHKKK